MLRYFLTLAAISLAVSPSFAELPSTAAGPVCGQPGSVIVAPSWGYSFGYGWGSGWGWGFGYYPYGGLYGGPEPTGGVTPGFFGGSDYQFHALNVSPGYGFWGWPPYVYGAARDFPQNPLPPGYNGPRFATKDVKARYAWMKANPAAESDRQTAELMYVNYGIRLLILLPADDCILYLQGQPMTGTGRERYFQSPQLPAGSSYKYTVTAKLPGDRTETKEVTGKPGEVLKVDFNAAPAALKALPVSLP